MQIADYIDASNAAGSKEAVFDLFLQALAPLGYDRVMYSGLVAPMRGRVAEPAIQRNYPDEWVDYYVAQGYVESDPVRRMCIIAHRPFAWSELTRSRSFSRAHLKIFDEARSNGLHDGIAVPLHGPRGEVTGIGLASSTGGTEPMAQLNKVNVIATQFHLAYQAVSRPEDPPEIVALTDREAEILRWCAAGKSNSVIAEILNVSEKTVEYHLAKAYGKLEVSNRVAAVVQALYRGLITP